jgi:hypothetical protein
MAKIGNVIGIDPARKRIWAEAAKVPAGKPTMMMPRLLGLPQSKVTAKGLLHVHADGTVHPCPKNASEINGGVIIAVACHNDPAQDAPWWKFRGFQTDAESTAGKSYLFGYTPDGKVCDVPKDLAWFQKFVSWGPETAENEAETAENGPETA